MGNFDLSGINEWGRYRPFLIRAYLFGEDEQFHKCNNWRRQMAVRTFTIELKIDLDTTDDRYEPMKRIAGQTARDMLASAMLLDGGSKKPPEITFFTEDQFFTVEELRLFDDDGNAPEEVPPVTTEGNADGA